MLNKFQKFYPEGNRKFSFGAFTLIELLVVIAIVGLIAAVIVVGASGTRAKARDAKRQAELDQIRKALESYYVSEGRYPTTTDWISLEEDGENNGPFSQAMKPDFLSIIPKDPLYPQEYESGKKYAYWYKATTPESYELYAKREQGGFFKISSELGTVAYSPEGPGGPPEYTLTVSKTGTGLGTVADTGINCGTTCATTYTTSTSVTLTATPAAGSYFAGWSGDCSGTGTCTLTMDANKSATATFNLTVWLSGYSYRKLVTLNGSTGAGTNYQAKLKIGKTSAASGEDFDLNGHVLDSFNDVRFTDNDKTTLLDYWIEKIEDSGGTKLATIWVEVADDLGSNQDIYVYYGNPSASSASNGANTFLFFDHFEGSALDSRWELVTPGTIYGYSTVTVAGSVLTFQGGLNTYWALRTTSSYRFPVPFAIEYYGKFAESTSNGRETVSASNSPTGSFFGNDMFSIGREGTPGKWYQTANDGTITTDARTSILTSWIKLKMIVTSGSVEFYENDVLKDTIVTNVPNDSMGPLMSVAQTVAYVYADYVFIRKYASPEPSFSLAGNEESL